MDQGRDFDSDPAGDRNFCRQSGAWKKKTVKAPDAESQGVMKITPIPTATPTPVPRQVNKDAVAQSGSVTMVNEYLVQKEEGKAAGSSKSGSSEEQTAADSSDSGSDATGNSTDEETETGSGDYFTETAL